MIGDALQLHSFGGPHNFNANRPAMNVDIHRPIVAHDVGTLDRGVLTR